MLFAIVGVPEIADGVIVINEELATANEVPVTGKLICVTEAAFTEVPLIDGSETTGATAVHLKENATALLGVTPAFRMIPALRLIRTDSSLVIGANVRRMTFCEPATASVDAVTLEAGVELILLGSSVQTAVEEYGTSIVVSVGSTSWLPLIAG
jgi:hypothetical protein